MILIAVLCKLIIIIVEYVLLGGFKLGDEVLDVSDVDAKFAGFRSDGYFIFDDRHEC